jgi:ParB-like nuclease domain
MKVKLSQIRTNPVHDQNYSTREIDGLVETMEMKELQKPIIVTSDNYIISGFRRYLVAKFLGWEEIEVIIGEKMQVRQEFTDLPADMPRRKKSGEILNEIQQLYQNYTHKQEGTGSLPNEKSASNNADNSRQLESWYW